MQQVGKCMQVYVFVCDACKVSNSLSAGYYLWGVANVVEYLQK